MSDNNEEQPQPPALSNVNEALKETDDGSNDNNNNNNNDDSTNASNETTTNENSSSGTPVVARAHLEESVTTDSMVSEMSESEHSLTSDNENNDYVKKIEEENYKRRLEKLIKHKMAEIGEDTEGKDKPSDDLEQLRKKLEQERVKIIEEIKQDHPEEKTEEKPAFKVPTGSANSTPRTTKKSSTPNEKSAPVKDELEIEKEKARAAMKVLEMNKNDFVEVDLGYTGQPSPRTPRSGRVAFAKTVLNEEAADPKNQGLLRVVREKLARKMSQSTLSQKTMDNDAKLSRQDSTTKIARVQSQMRLKDMMSRNGSIADLKAAARAEYEQNRKVFDVPAGHDEKPTREEMEKAEAKARAIEQTETKKVTLADLKNIPSVGAHLAIKINHPLKGNIEDHPMIHGKRAMYRLFFILTFILTFTYQITALPETFLANSPIWWFVLWLTTFCMSLAFLLFLSNFWYRATLKCEQYPEDARPNSTSEYNRFKGSVSLSLFPIAGEAVEMVRKHFLAVYDSHVTGLHRDVMVICDDFRIPHIVEEKEIPCLSALEPTQAFEEPYIFKAKNTDPKFLAMAESVARERNLTKKEDLSVTNADGTGYILWKFYNPENPTKYFYYMARHKWDNVPSMLKGANLNEAMEVPEIEKMLRNAPSGNSFVFIVDARHAVKAEFKAALLQYFWTWNPDAKQWMFHDKLASVQAQHWYPNIVNGHALQPNNRFFFDGVMKGRVARGSVANAGTMNLFQYNALKGIDEVNPEKNRFCTYSVTEDKASEIEYFIKGYYSVFHPYQVSSGVPATTIAKEFDRLLRWARGNFVILLRRNCLAHSYGLKPIFRLWVIEGTVYPINGCVTLLFYFASLLYVGFGVTFLTFHSVTILVMFLMLMVVGRVSYMLSVPSMTEEDMWANMQAWLNVMPVYVWSVLSYHKGYAQNAAWVSTGSKTVSDGMRIQWVVVGMQFLNILSICLGIGFLFGKGYVDMWEFFARLGLGLMLVVMQHACVKEILVQNNIIKKDAGLGPVVKFTIAIVAGLIFCLAWEFTMDPSK